LELDPSLNLFDFLRNFCLDARELARQFFRDAIFVRGKIFCVVKSIRNVHFVIFVNLITLAKTIVSFC
jgi:hypothetical protein